MKRSHPYPRIGVVACGGKSSRMGFDKSLINYHGKAQAYHLHDMMQELCKEVWLSCNTKQSESSFEASYNQLTDHPKYAHIGPMAALLTGFSKFGRANILLIGCDYPLLEKTDLDAFAAALKNDEPAAFYNPASGFYEPLLAYYPGNSFKDLQKRYAARNFSLQAFLKEHEALQFIPQQEHSMRSIDTPIDSLAIKKQLSSDA